MNTRLLDALHGRNTSGRPPVWLMRQAGRYMPQYRAIKEKYSFLEMCRQPEVAAEVTLLPIELLGVDGAILFADILLILDAMGRELSFQEKKGPVIGRPLSSPQEVSTLPSIDVEEKLGYVGEAVSLLKNELEVPLLGFAGAPFTVASYLIEGGSSRDLKKTKQWAYRDPESFHALLQYLTDLTIAYLKMQIRRGAQGVQLFDSWIHVLSHRAFMSFSAPYMKQIVEAVQKEAPVILFGKGSSLFAREMAALKPQGVSVDWNADLKLLRQELGGGITLQGNLDPHCLYAPPAHLVEEVHALLQSMNGDPAFIFNLGHGILPDMDLHQVRLLVDTVKGWQ